MSERVSAEERARLRDAILDWERNGESGELLGSPADCWAAMEHIAPTVEQIIAARVDRLTEALETERGYLREVRFARESWQARAERAIADLADEKRRHAELARKVLAQGGNSRELNAELRALLSDTTTGDAHQ